MIVKLTQNGNGTSTSTRIRWPSCRRTRSLSTSPMSRCPTGFNILVDGTATEIAIVPRVQNRLDQGIIQSE